MSLRARGTGNYEIVSPMNVRCYMPIKSYQHSCLKCMGENSAVLKRGEIVFRREAHTNWVSNTKWSALKTYTFKHYTNLSRFYLCI